jgi:predicted dehydrogenase
MSEVPSIEVPSIGVGMVGYAFMGRAHSQAWQAVSRAFDPPLRPRLAAICGRDRAATCAAADRLGWAAAETDWHALIARDDVQLIDIAAPGSVHAPIAIAALQAGKHVLCEKPLANTAAEAERMSAAADAAYPSGARAMVGFNYRRVPALALARRLVEQGRIGTLRHVRAVYLQDWLVDPDSPLTWRLQADQAGSGALGDLGAHIVDLARFLTGDEIAGVSAVSATFVEERPLLDGPEDRSATAGAAGAADANRTGSTDGAGTANANGTDVADRVGAADGTRRTGRVTVDDAVVFSARFASGALGSFEATRYAAGRKNGLRIELNGSVGSLAFELERLNELEFYDGDDTDGGVTAGFRRILVTEAEHPYLSGWWPPGHVIGWEHTFTHQAKDLLTAIAVGAQPRPSFGDGLAVQRVLDAAQRSAAVGGGWETIRQTTGSPVRSG